MLIKLSSINETDPTKFSNNFSDMVNVPPNSFVCLIKCQVNKLVAGKKIIIDKNTPLNVRYTAYDIKTIFLNPLADTTYTIDAFVDYVDSLLPNGTAFGRGQRFYNIETSSSSDDLEFRMFYYNPTTTYEQAIYSNTNYRRLYLESFNGKSMPKTGPGNIGVGYNQTQIGGDTGQYACGVGWDLNKYTPPVNQQNKEVHNMFTGNGDGSVKGMFIIGQPNLKSFKTTLGKATYSLGEYQTGPIVGTDQYTNPGDSWGNMLLNLNFKTNGKMDIQYFNVDLNNREDVVLDEPYNPGDIFELYPYTDGDTMSDYRRYYSLHLRRKVGNGLAYWIPGKTTLTAGNTSMVLNTIDGTPYNLSLEQFYIPNIDSDLTTCNAQFIHHQLDRTYMATGYRYTAGNATDNSGETGANSTETASAGGNLISNLINDVVPGLTGSIKAWLDNSFLLERWTTTAPPSPNSDKNAVCVIDTNGIPLNTPFFCSFFFKPIDDLPAASAGNNNMTLLGSTGTSKLLEITISQAEAWDINWYTNGGANPVPVVLTDPSSNRLNIAFGGNYYVSVCYMGTQVGTGKGRIIFRVYDIDADILYSTTGQDLVYDSNVLGYLGGVIPTGAQPYQSYSGAYYSDFRLYQKCASDLLTETTWDTIQEELQEYYKTGNITSVQWYFGGEGRTAEVLPTPNMLEASGEIKETYRIAGLPRQDETITQFFQRDTLAPPTDLNWYDIQNVYCPGSTLLPDADRNTTLDAGAYAGPQGGLVEVDEIQDELTFTDPTADIDENVLATPSITGDTVENPFLTLKADLKDRVFEEDTINVDLLNLPQRGYNGVNRTTDKTIYQMPIASDHKEIDNMVVHEVIVPQKVWLPLNNPGDIPLNSLDIQLSDVFGKKLDNSKYRQPTNIVIQIEQKNNIL